jgi:hypothetical protein
VNKKGDIYTKSKNYSFVKQNGKFKKVRPFNKDISAFKNKNGNIYRLATKAFVDASGFIYLPNKNSFMGMAGVVYTKNPGAKIN